MVRISEAQADAMARFVTILMYGSGKDILANHAALDEARDKAFRLMHAVPKSSPQFERVYRTYWAWCDVVNLYDMAFIGASGGNLSFYDDKARLTVAKVLRDYPEVHGASVRLRIKGLTDKGMDREAAANLVALEDLGGSYA